jgi:Zn-dependent peptidase ImmA (M78 family)
MYLSPIDAPTGITPSVIGTLRGLAPSRPLTFAESLRIAKLQAMTLLRTLGIEDGPVPVEFVDYLPHVRVIQAALPVSGVSHWTGAEWIITVSSHESWRRQRITIAHEFKHIIDHTRAHDLYAGDRFRTAAEQAEIAATYFAGCVLIPRNVLKQIWFGGMQCVGELADYFDVSQAAIRVRLAQVGLDTPADIHPTQVRRRRRTTSDRRQPATYVHSSQNSPRRSA